MVSHKIFLNKFQKYELLAMFYAHKRIKLENRNQGERSLECHQKYKTNFQRIYGSKVYHVGFKKIFQADIK